MDREEKDQQLTVRRDRRSVRWKDLTGFHGQPPKIHVDQPSKESFLHSFGKVADTFIPDSSRRRKGKCFGFVRFWEKKGSLEVESLDGSSIGRRKILVNLARLGGMQKEI